MAMGFGAAGMAQGIGQGMRDVAGMLNNYTMQQNQQAHQKDMQQNNPYVRLAASRMVGQGGGGYGTGATGSASDIGSAAINKEVYGKPGMVGGRSDPAGNFNPATMPMEDMLGDPMIGLNMRNQHTNQWQQQTVPIANAYIKAQTEYENAKAQLESISTEIPEIKMQAQRVLKELGQQFQAAEGNPQMQQEISQQIEKVRMGLLKKEEQHGALKNKIAGLEQAKREYGQQLSQVLPGLTIPEGESSLFMTGDRTLMGPEKAGPRHLGERIYPPGQVPPSMSSASYLPVTPRDPR